MTVLLIVIGVLLLLFCLFILFVNKRTITKIDGCSVEIRGKYEDAVVEYKEPSGQTLIFDAYWARPKRGKATLEVEFPVELSVAESETTVAQEAIERLAIPEMPSVRKQIPSTQRDEIKDRVSRALKELDIPHEFIRPQRSGWTSFEDGKEIYHG